MLTNKMKLFKSVTVFTVLLALVIIPISGVADNDEEATMEYDGVFVDDGTFIDPEDDYSEGYPEDDPEEIPEEEPSFDLGYFDHEGDQEDEDSEYEEIEAFDANNVQSFEELRQAVVAAGTTPTTILLTVPVIDTGTSPPIVIGANQNITILNGQPGAGSTVNIVRNDIPQPFENGRHFTVNGSLTLGQPAGGDGNNIILDNLIRNTGVPNGGMNQGDFPNNSTIRGGILVSGGNAVFTIHHGVVLQNNHNANHGGAVRVQSNGRFYMNGGVLQNNVGDANRGGIGNGGAVSLTGANSRFTMSGGSIHNNTVLFTGLTGDSTHGGGVSIQGGAQFTMNGGVIRDNILGGGSTGGGVAVMGTGSRFVMNSGTISGNQATLNGGGVSVVAASFFDMRAGTISGNRVINPNSNGGGVFTFDITHNNLRIGTVDGVNTSDQIHFYGNTSGAYDGSPLLINMGIAEGLATRPYVRWNNWENAHLVATTSVPDITVHLINNWDINVTIQTPYTILRILTKIDGGIDAYMRGTAPYMTTRDNRLFFFPVADGTVTLDAGTRVGYVFSHWTTAACIDGTALVIPDIHNNTNSRIEGIRDLPGQNIYVTAHWISAPEHTVTFALHGGTGNIPDQRVMHGELATRPTTNPSREGYDFVGWFTAATGGEAFDFATPITGDTVVHAQWRRVAQPPQEATPPPPSVVAQAPSTGDTVTFPLSMFSLTLFSVGVLNLTLLGRRVEKRRRIKT